MAQQESPIESRDRRQSPRVVVAFPAQVDFVSHESGHVERLVCSVLTLGARGLSILAPKPLSRDQYVDLYLGIPKSKIPLRLSGTIRWSIPDEEAKFYLGIRLDAIPPTSQTIYRALFADQLLAPNGIKERRLSRELSTEVARYTNRAGRKIVGLIDKSVQRKEFHACVVIPPGYGEMKTDALMLAYYLAKNGFVVLRYDATDHVGESEGDILNTMLSTMEKDVTGSIDYLKSTYPDLPIGVIATSLSARAALRASVSDRRIRFVIGIASVVHLQATLKSVYKADLVAAYESGKIRGTADILGFNVCDDFLADATKNGFHTLEGTQQDLAKTAATVTLFACERDPWVNLEDVKKVIDSDSKATRQIIVIPSAFHNMYEDHATARDVLKKIVAGTISSIKKIHFDADSVVEPTIREIAHEARLERQRTRLISRFESTDRIGFWEKYLTSFNLILKSADFQTLLQTVAKQLGDLSGARLLDAGCGNGNFGAWLMLAKDYHKSLNQPLFYVGIDYANAALIEAQKRFQEIQKDHASRNGSTRPLIEWSLNVCDLNRPLPFLDSYFDKVCSNLVLSYVDDPLFTLIELRRVLKVGGHVAITSVKPMGNFSRVFNNFVRSTNKDVDLQEARKLISNAGTVRHREKEGHFHFYSSEELLHLLQQAGFGQLESSAAFEGDINIASGIKV